MGCFKAHVWGLYPDVTSDQLLYETRDHLSAMFMCEMGILGFLGELLVTHLKYLEYLKY